MEVRHLHPRAHTKSALLAGALAASGAGADEFSYIGGVPEPVGRCGCASGGVYPTWPADFPDNAMRAGPKDREPISCTDGPSTAGISTPMATGRQRLVLGVDLFDGDDLRRRLFSEFDDELREPLVLANRSCDPPKIESAIQLLVPGGPGIGGLESGICSGEKAPPRDCALRDPGSRVAVAEVGDGFEAVIATIITRSITADVQADGWIGSALLTEIAFPPKPYGAGNDPWFKSQAVRMALPP